MDLTWTGACAKAKWILARKRCRTLWWKLLWKCERRDGSKFVRYIALLTIIPKTKKPPDYTKWVGYLTLFALAFTENTLDEKVPTRQGLERGNQRKADQRCTNNLKLMTHGTWFPFFTLWHLPIWTCSLRWSKLTLGTPSLHPSSGIFTKKIYVGTDLVRASLGGALKQFKLVQIDLGYHLIFYTC